MGCVKLKNIFGEPWKQAYRDLKISARPTQSCGLAASSQHIAFPWDVGSGGIVALIDINNFGRNPPIVKLSGHCGSIQDLAFNEFDENIIASASDDCTIKIWDVNNDGNLDINKAKSNLVNHSLKVTNLSWNPVVDYVLLSGSSDCSAKVWDASVEKEIFSVSVNDPVSYVTWKSDGNLILVSTKEANVSLLDPRSGAKTLGFKAHDSNKLTHGVWLGGPYGNDHILTTGFVNNKTRQIRIWDSRNTEKTLLSKDVDSSSSPLFPHWDEKTGVLSLAAKGDMTVRLFQYFENELNKAGEFKTSGSIKSFCLIPNSICDKTKCELGRFLTNENCTQINATSMFIIRRNNHASMVELYGDSNADRRRTTVNDWSTGSLAKDIGSLQLCSDDGPLNKSDAVNKFRDISSIITECNNKYAENFNDSSVVPLLEKIQENISELISLIRS